LSVNKKIDFSTVVPIFGGWVNGLQPTPLPGFMLPQMTNGMVSGSGSGSLIGDKSVRNYFPETWLMINLTTG
jgi:hypothetical protein